MNLIIVSPQEKRTIPVSWIEINTAIGNFVIQTGHIPTILLISSHQPITFCLANGKQETLTPSGGILEIQRNKATLLLNE
jgi:F0F1-type ATP synthase epsilon subunit